jgi:hypothetical protein
MHADLIRQRKMNAQSYNQTRNGISNPAVFHSRQRHSRERRRTGNTGRPHRMKANSHSYSKSQDYSSGRSEPDTQQYTCAQLKKIPGAHHHLSRGISNWDVQNNPDQRAGYASSGVVSAGVPSRLDHRGAWAMGSGKHNVRQSILC